MKFGEVVRQIKDKVDPNISGLERFVAGEHMDSDDLRIRRWGDIGDGYLGPAFHMRFRPGQVLYGSRRTYLRKVAVADFEGICANTTFVLDSADPAVLRPEILPFIMQTEAFHEHSRRESKGSVNPYVNFSDLAWYQFSLPSLQEQLRYCAALSAAELAYQSARDLATAASCTADAFAAAAFRGEGMREMIPHPRLGLVSADWPVMTIGSLTDSDQYGLSTAPQEDGQYPILRMMNVVDGFVVENDLRYVDLPEEVFSTYRLESGDVLFNRTNSIDLVGRTGVYTLEGEHVFASYLVRLKVKRDILSPEYLTAYLNAPLGRQQVLSFATKAVSQANVSASNLARVLMPLPPRHIQDRIVADLAHMKLAQDQAMERAQRAVAVKRAMLQSLAVPLEAPQ
ncbi:restriction endonuclease subunit S [Nannocystis pusilla]|uniref:Restriction endonuclease subunit S n=1 Tax=Nannocystis pusilla TaxID=889268 RepID=A0ABS7U003_9BACT|nr:restriction endonuclease subunit S [Nannocystis pusilla]